MAANLPVLSLRALPIPDHDLVAFPGHDNTLALPPVKLVDDHFRKRDVIGIAGNLAQLPDAFRFAAMLSFLHNITYYIM